VVSALCYNLSVTGGATGITITCAACSDMGGTAMEYSGCSCAFDNVGTAGNKSITSTTTSPTSNSFTPAGAGELIIVNYADESTSTTPSAVSPYTLINADASHVDAQEQDLSGAAGAQTAGFTLSATSSTGTLQLGAWH
jgi:hypothetical protein